MFLTRLTPLCPPQPQDGPPAAGRSGPPRTPRPHQTGAGRFVLWPPL